MSCKKFWWLGVNGVIWQFGVGVSIQYSFMKKSDEELLLGFLRLKMHLKDCNPSPQRFPGFFGLDEEGKLTWWQVEK